MSGGRAVRRLARAGRGDQGSVSAFVVVLAAALLVVAGLVVDGGRAVNARAAAADDAEQAARAGATRIDEAVLRSSGQVRLDQQAATAAARAYLADRGYGASDVELRVDQTTVHVLAREVVATSLLQLIFIETMAVEGEATARAAVGIDAEIPLPGGP